MAYDDSRTSAAPRPLPLPPLYWTRGPKPDWLLLPRDVLAAIFLKLSAVDIIESAQKVCTLWHSASMDPSLWKHIDIRNGRNINIELDLDHVCREAVDRSRGGCLDISIEGFGDNSLLRYIVDSGCQLRRLRLVSCLSISDIGMAEAAPRLPFLETFEYFMGSLKEKALIALRNNIPPLTSLRFELDVYSQEIDDEAFAIAKHMPRLRRLSIFGNNLTNKRLGAILDGCPCLESLDLRQCYKVDLMGDLAKKCERIKDLKRPDSTARYRHYSYYMDYFL